MKNRPSSRNIALLALSALLALALAACGGATSGGGAAGDDAAVETAATEEPVATEEPAAEEAATEEPAAEAEESQKVVTEVVEQSQAAQASELEAGITVTSDEDVSTPRDKFGGEYKSVSSSDAVSFHPYLTTDTGSSGYQSMIYSGALLRLDENTLEYLPNMAESYSISEDGLTFTFNLRPELVWSDGEPLTAYDFEWSYNQAINPDYGFPDASQLEFITGYEALDDHTLEIKIDEIYAPALGQMSGLITPLPKHIWENLDWDDPETNPEINSPTVVSGPYTLTEWKRDQYAIFEANENYWYRGEPNITRQVIEIVPDNDIGYQKMKSGESDTGPITPENLEEARNLENLTVYEWWPAAAVWDYVGMNMREGFATHDINVRQGLAYAIDKQLLTDEVWLGQAKRLCSIYPETSWVYNPDVPCYDYDVDAALAKFEEAGYTFDGEKMVNADGEQLKLKLIYGPNTSETRELIAVVVQDFLGDIGIEVEIQALEWASFLEATDSEDPDWDMYIGGWRATIEPHIMYTIWSEDSIPELNSVAYVNKDVEALFEEAGATYDTDFRREKYQEIQRLVAEDAPYIFLDYRKSWSGQNNRVQGIEPTALGIGWNSDDWYIEETAE